MNEDVPEIPCEDAVAEAVKPSLRRGQNAECQKKSRFRKILGHLTD